MAGREISVKKYVVKLSAEEREQLEAMICAGKHPAQSLTKARILLKADVSETGEGWSDRAISAALDTSINNIGRTRRRLVEEGIAAALTRRYNPKGGGGEIDRPDLLAGARGVRPLEFAPARGEGRRTEHCREGQRQHDRKDAKKNVLKPHRNRQWVIPPDANAGFVAAMARRPSCQERRRQRPRRTGPAWLIRVPRLGRLQPLSAPRRR